MAAEASNVGFVLDTKRADPGTVTARGIFTDRYRGPGVATGGPGDGFAGGEVSAVGVGMDVGNGSAVDWRKVGR